MTGWWAVYSSKDKKDMIWPDMIWVYIIVYDIWNFAYTYNCLPTHAWFCGIALLLAPDHRRAAVEQRGLDYEPGEYSVYLVYVCAGISTVSGDSFGWNAAVPLGDTAETLCGWNIKWHIGGRGC